MANSVLYTKEQVLRIVEEAFRKMDETPALQQEPLNLDNDMPQKTSPENTKVTLTVAEAAEVVGISKPKMYELVRAGKFRIVKIGKKILISRQSLMDWLKKGDSYGKETC
ncbi:MAG: helix-turn-helix domain-containing protein [Clostridia bacterium]|nr:helix-turn-helix domain-containing protein [Clostridia bacterium]